MGVAEGLILDLLYGNKLQVALVILDDLWLPD